jgi:hypothetical protein
VRSWRSVIEKPRSGRHKEDRHLWIMPPHVLGKTEPVHVRCAEVDIG